MSIKAVFAGNLRALCKRRGGPISAICQETRIQRNQMDRYLGAKNLPNERNLKRLSDYFGVTEAAMFASPGAGGTSQPSPNDDRECRALLDRMFAGGRSAVPEGMYETTFPIATDSKRLMVSLTVVRHVSGKSLFRRITRSWQSRRSREASIRGDHSGVVIDRFGGHYFLGLNKVGTHEPSLAILRPLPIGDLMLGGRALIITELGMTSLPLVMRPLGAGADIRSALRSLGPRKLGDQNVEPLVAQFIRRPTF